MNISQFLTSDKYILQLKTDKNGREYLESVKKGFWTFLAVKCFKFKSYQLKTIVDYVNQSNNLFEDVQQKTNFYTKLQQKITKFEGKHHINLNLLFNLHPSNEIEPKNQVVSIQSSSLSGKEVLYIQDVLPIVIGPSEQLPVSKENINTHYQTMKAVLQKDPNIRVEFNDQQSTFTFYHHEREIESILRNKELNQFIIGSLTILRIDLTLFQKSSQSIFEVISIKNQFDNHQEKENILLEEAQKIIEKTPTKQIDIDNMQAENPSQLYNTLLDNYEGLSFGEIHSQNAARCEIIKNLPIFAKKGVKTLYLEHFFYDSMQPLLDQYNQSESDEMPSYLETYVDQLDAGFSLGSDFGYKALLKAAKQAGIKIVAIDTTASYNCGVSDKLGVKEKGRRYLGMNATAYTIIQKEQVKQQGKYVALMGSGHVATVSEIETIVPGVAELLQIPSIVIENKKLIKANQDYQATIAYNVKDHHKLISHVSALITVN